MMCRHERCEQCTQVIRITVEPRVQFVQTRYHIVIDIVNDLSALRLIPRAFGSNWNKGCASATNRNSDERRFGLKHQGFPVRIPRNYCEKIAGIPPLFTSASNAQIKENVRWGADMSS